MIGNCDNCGKTGVPVSHHALNLQTGNPPSDTTQCFICQGDEFDPYGEMPMGNPEHNPDTNPNWRSKMAYRVYACSVCGTETKIQTNHTGSVPSSHCAGTCKDIFNPHTAREVVVWHAPRKHVFVRDVE